MQCLGVAEFLMIFRTSFRLARMNFPRQARYASGLAELSPSLTEMKLNGLVVAGEGSSFLYAPVHWMETGLAVMHDMTGLPWWASIMAWTCAIKLVTLPLSIKQTSASLRLQAIRPLLEPHQQAAKQYQQQGNMLAAQAQYIKAREIMKEHKCSPLASLGYALISIPFFIAAFFSIKEICDSKFPAFMTGGTLWFTDLTAPDPYYLLPTISAVGLLLSIEAGRWTTGQSMSGMMVWGIRFASVMSIPITASMGSSILIYFGTLNFFNALIHMFWRSARIRSLVGFKLPQATPTIATENKVGSLTASFREAYKSRTQHYERKAQLEEQKKRLMPTGPVEFVHEKRATM